MHYKAFDGLIFSETITSYQGTNYGYLQYMIVYMFYETKSKVEYFSWCIMARLLVFMYDLYMLFIYVIYVF